MALKIVKSAEHYTEAAIDEIKVVILNQSWFSAEIFRRQRFPKF